MRDQGPFDRILDSSRTQDRNARLILMGMGVIGLVLLVLVLPPISLLSDDSPVAAPEGASLAQQAGRSRLPRLPEGFEALSGLMKPGARVDLPAGTPSKLTVSLIRPVNDGRHLGLYTYRNGRWERLAAASLVNNGTAVEAVLGQIPANVAVLRRTSGAALVSGWLLAGAQPDPAALAAIGVLNPVDYYPGADGAVLGNATLLPEGKGTVLPTVRAAAQREVDAVNALLASPNLRETHTANLVQVALQPGNAGIDLDYQRVSLARRADFTAFVGALADRLHEAGRSLSLTLPLPAKNGVNWDTGAYDWEEIGRRADLVKLSYEPDPSAYFKGMTEALDFVRSKVEAKKLSLLVTRQSVEKGTDGLRGMALHEALTLASQIELRTSSAITPNSSVVIVAKNMFQDEGATGLHWDEGAFAVSFAYPGRGGQRTVWLENAFSIAFKLDLARRHGLAGVAIDDVALNPAAASFWEPLRAYAEAGVVGLAQPNGALLRPVWQAQAGSTEPGTKGNVVWKAPAQPGAYDIALVISDGVIRASQKIALEVRPPGTSVAPPSATPRPGATPPRP